MVSFELQKGLTNQYRAGMYMYMPTDNLPAEIREVCLVCENNSTKVTLNLSVVNGNHSYSKYASAQSWVKLPQPVCTESWKHLNMPLIVVKHNQQYLNLLDFFFLFFFFFANVAHQTFIPAVQKAISWKSEPVS